MLSNGGGSSEVAVGDQPIIPNGSSMAQHAPQVVSQATKKLMKNSDKIYNVPQFYDAIESELTIEEGEPLRLLTRVGPAEDSSLSVQWFKDGKHLSAGSRFSTIMDRGFIVLDIHYTIVDDTGEYVCQATSNSGSAETNKSIIKILPESNMGSQTQLPADMMQSINDLEARNNVINEYHQGDDRNSSKSPPKFVDDTSNTFTITQGHPVHLEAFVEQYSDSSLVIDWQKDGKPISSGSRINTIYDRGYCSLDIAYCYPEDSGEYVCLAKNAMGVAQSLPNTLICHPEESIVTKSNLTESSICNLKAFEYPGDEYSMGFQHKEDPIPPTFKATLEPQSAEVIEGQPICFRVPLDPGNGEKLSYDWYHNDEVIDTCSRLTGKLEMNVASLSIQYTLATDSGNYKCVMFSEHGRVETECVSLAVQTEQSVISTPQSKGISAIQALEAELNAPKLREEQDDRITDIPSFVRQPEPVKDLIEGDSLTLATRVEPERDNSLYVDWYKNGEQLMNGARSRITYERGVAILNMNSLIAEDSGEYWATARNKNGQTESNRISINCTSGEKVVTTSSLLEDSEGFKRIKEMEEDLAHINTFDFQNVEDEETESPPHFDVKPMNITVGEGCPAKFLVKISGFPRPKIEWTIDEVPVAPDSLCKTYNDGSINYLEINRCSELGESQIHVTATNDLGTAEADALLTVVQTVNFKQDLKHITPENPYKKMADLKKVQCTDELANAMKKSKPTAEVISNMEKTEFRSRFNRGQDTMETEKLYDQVASRLRKSTLHSRAPSGSRSPNMVFNANNGGKSKSPELQTEEN